MPAVNPDDDDAAYRTARSRYQSSYMSNAKWVRLFTAIARSGIVIERAEWHFIGSDYTESIGLPRENELFPTRFADGRFQPYEYKWILSIFIPRAYRPIANVGFSRAQDVLGLRATIESAGQFQLEERDAGLTIHAYG